MIDFKFSNIELEYTALTSFNQPYFLGSAFRGILGRRLKRIVCIKPREDCRSCKFNKTCPYTIIFETELYFNQPSKYVLQPEYSSKELKDGEKLYINITLLGQTANYWEFITEALNTVINLGKDRFIKFSGLRNKPKTFYLKEFWNLNSESNKVFIKMYPTSLKFQGKFIKANEFNKDLFVKAILSRVSNVAASYGMRKGKLFIDKGKFVMEDVNFRPSPMVRWSNRKRKKMIIPAFEGEFLLKGDLKGIYPFLRIIEKINLGKSTSFGLGRVLIREIL